MPDAPSDQPVVAPDASGVPLGFWARLFGSFFTSVVLLFFGLIVWSLGSPMLPMGRWGGELMFYVLLAVAPIQWVVLFRRNSTRNAMEAPWRNLAVFAGLVGAGFLLAALVWPECPENVAPIGVNGLYSRKQAAAFSAKAPVSARQAYGLLAERVAKGEVIGEKDKWARKYFLLKDLDNQDQRVVFFVLKGRYYFPSLKWVGYSYLRRWYDDRGCFVDPVSLQMEFVDSYKGIWNADCANWIEGR